jgi:hypothetical protein
MPFRTTSASSRPRIFGFWRERGIYRRRIPLLVCCIWIRGYRGLTGGYAKQPISRLGAQARRGRLVDLDQTSSPVRASGVVHWSRNMQQPKSAVISGTIQTHRKTILKTPVSMPRTAFHPQQPLVAIAPEGRSCPIPAIAWEIRFCDLSYEGGDSSAPERIPEGTRLKLPGYGIARERKRDCA